MADFLPCQTMTGNIHMNTSINSKEQEAQTICKACGLCCDGTIFKRAVLKPDDTDESLHTAGILAIQDSEKKYFNLPCHHLNNRLCNIYHLWRPGICSRFRCKTLELVISGELSSEQGLEIVNKTLNHLAELKQQINVSDVPNTVSLQVMFNTWEKKQIVPDKAILLNYFALRLRLTRNFNKIKNDSNCD